MHEQTEEKCNDAAMPCMHEKTSTHGTPRADAASILSRTTTRVSTYIASPHTPTRAPLPHVPVCRARLAAFHHHMHPG